MTRVVVTGMGWITPLGNDLDTVWKRMCNGESAIALIDRFDASSFPTKFAGQVRDFDWTQYVKDADVHRQPAMNSKFALGAADFACFLAQKPPFEVLLIFHATNANVKYFNV